MYFIFHAENEFTNTPFIVESDNILNAHIKFQEFLEKIDERLNKEFPGRANCDCKTTVGNIHEAPFASFSEEWIEHYVEAALEEVAMEFEDEDD